MCSRAPEITSPVNSTAETARRLRRSTPGQAAVQVGGANGDAAVVEPFGERVEPAGQAQGCGGFGCLPRGVLQGGAALLADELLGVGLDGVPEVEAGVESAAHPGDQGHGSQGQQEVLGQLEGQ